MENNVNHIQNETGGQDPVQLVKQYIYRQMELQQLNEGDRLPSEVALSQLLDIPRNNVRDALQSLKGIGLLNSVRGSGYVLSPNFDYSLAEVLHAMMSVSNISIKDINEVRQALEKKALELIIKSNAGEDAFAEMDRQVRIMEQHSLLGAPGKVNPRACVEADKNFHKLLSIISNNTFIRAFNISLNQYYDGYVALHWDSLSVEDTERLIASHKNLVKNLKKHKLDKSMEDLEMHYKTTEDILRKMYDSESDDMKELDKIIRGLRKKGFTAKQIQEKLGELE